MNCPYCNAKLSDDPRDYEEYHEYLYTLDLHCWDEYRYDCPKCGETFRWFENYVFIGQSELRVGI